MSKLTIWARDTAERAGIAAAAAFFAAWGGSLPSTKAALVAAGVAALTTLASAGAKFIGNGASGSYQKDLPAEQVAADPKVTP